MSRIRIPETYESENLKQLKKQLEDGEMTRLTDFLEEVENCVTGWKNILIWQKKIIGNQGKAGMKKERNIREQKRF